MCENTITPVLQSILDLVLAKAEACDEMPGWCRSGIVGGSAAWDVCCECSDGSGQLWVRLVGWETDPAFEPVSPHGCDQPTLLIVGVGSLRCIPTIDDQGNPPSAEEDTLAATLINSDTQLIRDAVMCGLDERFWRSWLPLDYQGGCGGGEHQFAVPFGGCSCDET